MIKYRVTYINKDTNEPCTEGSTTYEKAWLLSNKLRKAGHKKVTLYHL